MCRATREWVCARGNAHAGRGMPGRRRARAERGCGVAYGGSGRQRSIGWARRWVVGSGGAVLEVGMDSSFLTKPAWSREDMDRERAGRSVAWATEVWGRATELEDAASLIGGWWEERVEWERDEIFSRSCMVGLPRDTPTMRDKQVTVAMHKLQKFQRGCWYSVHYFFDQN
jgi:hypothetical protein